MKGGWQRKQDLAEEIEEKPSRHQAEQAFHGTDETGKAAPPQQRNTREFCETRGADDSILVLGNAFAAEITSTRRTAGDSFPLGMIETALICQDSHQKVRGGVFGSSIT